jgi:hypothetical protein
MARNGSIAEFYVGDNTRLKFTRCTSRYWDLSPSQSGIFSQAVWHSEIDGKEYVSDT